MIKISFDFDGTLGSKPSVQEYAKELVDKGFEVWIVTRRYDALERYTSEFNFKYKIQDLEKEHLYLFEVARYCGIPRDRIRFTNMEDKWPVMNELNFLWHLDDDNLELNDINKYSKTVGISVYGNWKNKCVNLIKRTNKKSL